MSTALVSGEAFASPEPTQKKSDLRISGLIKSFDKTVPILRGVDFSVAEGEAVVLIGANGAGKSTLMRACIGLLPVDGGKIEILGKDITALNKADLRAVRAQVGFIFQKHNLVPRLSALTNVIHGAQARLNDPRLWHQLVAPKDVRDEAMHCLDQVGLSHIAMQRTDRLSGGQSQRVAIARALMQRPKLMMADEPVASLDPNAGEDVMSLFVDLIRRQGISLFYSSHNLEHALVYSDRVIGLQNGVIALNAASDTQQTNGLRGIYD